DVERPRRDAAVETPPGKRPLGAGELHSNPEGKVAHSAPMSQRPAGDFGGASSLSAMRVCAIDVGSNTVRVLVADVLGAGAWRIADQDQTITRLGENLARTGALGEAPMARTLDAVRGYVERGARLGAGDIRIVATSAVREAANGRAFAAAVER